MNTLHSRARGVGSPHLTWHCSEGPPCSQHRCIRKRQKPFHNPGRSHRPRRLRSRRYRQLKRHMQLLFPGQGRPRARGPGASRETTSFYRETRAAAGRMSQEGGAGWFIRKSRVAGMTVLFCSRLAFVRGPRIRPQERRGKLSSCLLPKKPPPGPRRRAAAHAPLSPSEGRACVAVYLKRTVGSALHYGGGRRARSPCARVGGAVPCRPQASSVWTPGAGGRPALRPGP